MCTRPSLLLRAAEWSESVLTLLVKGHAKELTPAQHREAKHKTNTLTDNAFG